MSGRKIWMILVAVWFVAWALLAITNVRFEASNLLMGVLALAAGIMMLLDR